MRKVLNSKYILSICLINFVQVMCCKIIFQGDILALSLGYDLLYYDNVACSIFSIFPFVCIVYTLINMTSSEFLVSYMYRRYRFDSFKKWIFDFMARLLKLNFITFTLSYLVCISFLVCFDEKPSFTRFAVFGIFYVINNTMFLTLLALISATINTLIKNTTSNSILIFVGCIVCYFSNLAPKGKLVFSFLMILPTTHISLFSLPIHYIASSTFLIFLLFIGFNSLSLLMKKSDILN